MDQAFKNAKKILK